MPNTREKLIELLVNSPGLDTLYGKEEEFAENADWLIANGVTVQEWIPVTERLPEKEGFYLVVTKNGTVYSELYFLCGDPPEPSFGWDGVSKGKYTHWMPLPQPPKGE